MKIRPFIKTFTTLLITALGAYASYTIFHSLALFSPPPKEAKDTVLVRLLNVNGSVSNVLSTPSSSAGTGTGQTGMRNGYDSNGRPFSKPADSFSQGSYAHPTLQLANLLERPITASQQAAATQAIQLKNPALPKWLFILVGVAILGAVFYVVYYNLPYFSDEMNKDLDPPALTRLFELVGPAMLKLGNPRKIKRFSNKLRFQYHYLDLKNLADENSLKALGNVLVLLESPSGEDKSIVDPKKIAGLEDFYDWTQWHRIYNFTSQARTVIFALNKDALIGLPYGHRVV